MEDVLKKCIEIDNLYVFNEVSLDIFYVLFLLKVFNFVYMYIFKDIN